MKDNAIFDVDKMTLSLQFQGETHQFQIIRNVNYENVFIDSFTTSDYQTYDMFFWFQDLKTAHIIVSNFMDGDYLDDGIEIPLIVKESINKILT